MISLNIKEKAVADDMFQDLFLSIVRTPIPADVDRVAAFLYKIVTNDVIDETRRVTNYAQFARQYRERGNHKTAQESPDNDVMELEETRMMLRSLRDGLPAHEAEAVIQRYIYGNKTGDAARKMKVDKKTFSQYVYRGKTKIRDLLRKKRENQRDKNEYVEQSNKL